jgi:choline-sulfatase
MSKKGISGSKCRFWTYWLTISFHLVFSSSAFCAPGKSRPPVILISVDTLRADHLSCYGYRRIQTPAIDSVGKGGTLFTQIDSQVPLTFPSHVSLLTSTYPFSSGIGDNSEVLRPDAITLATVLKSQGYSTGAFVGGFALDRRFGLDQGFDVYDSPFDLNRQRGVDPSDLKRPGEDVTRSAEAWLDKNAAGPFFLFLHFYDLHTPYQLPAEARARLGGSGYDAELRYVDETLGQFWDFLREKGLLDKALVVFLSDHGESLGEHGEATHGYFIYQSTLHVPLIIHWPEGAGPFPARVKEPASLLDVAPTILQFLHILPPPHFQGRDLLEPPGSKVEPPRREIYSESQYAHNHYRCSALRSLRDCRYKYIEAPKPELYDLDHDPHELTNLYRHQRVLAFSLRQRLRSLRGRYPTAHTSSASAVSPEVVEQLSALGYVTGTSAHHDDSDSGTDPKDRIVQYQEIHRAISMAYSGRVNESVAALENVLTKTPDLPDARNILGLFQQKLGRHEQAARNFRYVLMQDPSNALAHYNLAISYFNANRTDDAIRELNAVVAIATEAGRALEHVTTPAQELLGIIWIQRKEYNRGRVQFERLLTIAPRDYVAHYNLGWLAGMEGNLDQGVQHLQVAVEVEPDNAEAHTALGNLYLRRGNLPEAQDQFADAIRLTPNIASVHYNLGVVLARGKRNEEAAAEFKKALQEDPNFGPAREALQRMEETR